MSRAKKNPIPNKKKELILVIEGYLYNQINAYSEEVLTMDLEEAKTEIKDYLEYGGDPISISVFEVKKREVIIEKAVRVDKVVIK